ncbi:MAG TPA: LysM domain-containing protein [Planctomycetota bacterium]|nr:LysM domain-containing protein [Planctomycetota bacterium]
MNTKVKVGIAAAIVAALVALIVLDQKAAPPPGAPAAPASGGEVIASPLTNGPDPVQRNREEEVRDLLRRVHENLGPGAAPRTPSAPPAAPAAPAAPNAPALAPSKGEEYAIESGDTLETIAQAKYGSRTYQSLILDANPGLNPTALRVGKKIVLPPKPEKAEKAPEAVVTKDLAPEAPAADVVGVKTYVVQAGDTLSGISSKVYKTSRYVDKIMAANGISDPHLVTIGMKLTMPDLPIKNAAASPVAQVTASAPAVAGKTHTVQAGDSLWRVAEAYAAQKGMGILDMMKELIKANPDKLKDEKTLLRLGWQLVVPE